MTPASELIWRNLARLNADEPVLLVAPPADDLASRLAHQSMQGDLLCLSFAAHRRAIQGGLNSGFGLAPPGNAQWSQVILFQPREKALLDMLLDVARDALRADGTLWLVGENRAGIKSAGKRLDRPFEEWTKVDNARHCTLFSARRPRDDTPFRIDDYFERWKLDSPGQGLEIHSLPGVFAHGRLDAGTRLLLETLTTPPVAETVSGRILDFACGTGVIGLALAAAHPGSSLTLLDDSALALESARRTFAANGMTAELVASDGLGELLGEDTTHTFDWVVSNPPFHRGVAQRLDTARAFVTGCPGLLAPGGRLCLVANQHLPYAAWLSELYGEVQVIAADRGYNVWSAATTSRRKKTGLNTTDTTRKR